jgi:hypothetical protein
MDIVSGSGLGLFNTSGSIGGAGSVLGLSSVGQGGRSHVKAANTNLVLQLQNEGLASRGADLGLLRTYNSRGELKGATGTNNIENRPPVYGGGIDNVALEAVTRDGPVVIQHTISKSSFVDAEGDPLAFSYSGLTAGNKTLAVTETATTISFRITLPRLTAGVFRWPNVTVAATDPGGGSASASFQLMIHATRFPV